MEDQGFESADIVFITDGYCELPQDLRDELARKQAEQSFRITGILLDTGVGAVDFSLKPFIYRTSEMFRDDIVRSLINKRE